MDKREPRIREAIQYMKNLYYRAYKIQPIITYRYGKVKYDMFDLWCFNVDYYKSPDISKVQLLCRIAFKASKKFPDVAPQIVVDLIELLPRAVIPIRHYMIYFEDIFIAAQKGQDWRDIELGEPVIEKRVPIALDSGGHTTLSVPSEILRINTLGPNNGKTEEELIDELVEALKIFEGFDDEDFLDEELDDDEEISWEDDDDEFFDDSPDDPEDEEEDDE